MTIDDLSDRLSVAMADDEPAAAQYVAAQMDPFTSAPLGAPLADVVLERSSAPGSARFVDLQNRTRDGVAPNAAATPSCSSTPPSPSSPGGPRA